MISSDKLDPSNKEKNLDKISEQTYTNLSTAIQSASLAIKFLVWPVAVLFFLSCLFIGYTSWNLREDNQEAWEDIQKTREDAINEGESLEKKVEETENSLTDITNEYNSKVAQLNSDLGKMTSFTEQLTGRASSTIQDAEGLIATVERSKGEVTDLLTQTNTAYNSTQEAREKIDELKAEGEKELEKYREVNKLFVQYFVYVAKGRNVFPDPFIDKENEIINKIANLLFSDEKEKNAFIQELQNM